MSCLLLLLSPSFVWADDGADADAWDQAAVTRLANELEQLFDALYEKSQNAPPQQTALQQRSRDAAQGAIRRSRDRSAEYAEKMRAGWDRDASEPYFRLVVEEVTDIFDTAGDAKPKEGAQPKIDRMQAVLSELRAYYDAP